MIKFFRKIRQKLLSENRFRKYLLYAVGEILLVVIGILIALQINNSNDLRKQDETKQSYYNQLIIDIDKDSIVIDGLIVRTQKQIGAYETYLDMFKTPDIEVEDIIAELSNLDSSIPSLTFNDNTLQTLISSGNINLMPIKIRNGLLDMKRIKDVVKDAERINSNGYLKLAFSAYEKGTWDIDERLKNQPKYAEFLKIPEAIHDRALLYEAAFDFKNFGDKTRVGLLKNIQDKLSVLKQTIQSEMK